MSEEIQIPVPIFFNPYKHHRNFILELLETSSLPEIKNLLVSVCDNYIDIYTGNYTPKMICNEMLDRLGKDLSSDKGKFETWLAENNGFRVVKLGDESEWIVRKGSDDARFIHLHPAKTGQHTIRFKGSSLKTIYQFKMEFPDKKSPFELDLVNKARKKSNLPPIKKLEPGKGILRCWELFF
jgi:hypothetical protein